MGKGTVREGAGVHSDFKLLAIDPGAGDKKHDSEGHVGVAEFRPEPWRCVKVQEMTPSEFLWRFSSRVPLYHHIACEDWRLNPQKAPLLGGSRMPTSKLIGKIEMIVDLHNWAHPECPVEFELREMHDPNGKGCRGIISALNLAGIDLVSPANPDHMRSAELHGWKWLGQRNWVPGLEIR